ncbi:MAG: DNA polymerase subunit beta [Candidatus Thorarchaeota archaeon]
MPREKTVRRDTGSRDVSYTASQWAHLSRLRDRAIEIMGVLNEIGSKPLVHGSICRGDVSEQSDIDVYLPNVIPSFSVEFALTEAGYQIIDRVLVHATPFHAIKAHIYLPNNSVVTFPLTNPSPIELEFYRFGGCLNQIELKNNQRVPGVDKRLILIEPTKKGHVETPVIGNELIVAKKVDVSLKIVEERVKILMRRDEVGRTGVYLKRQLTPEETFEGTLKHICDRDPVVRRRVQKG